MFSETSTRFALPWGGILAFMTAGEAVLERVVELRVICALFRHCLLTYSNCEDQMSPFKVCKEICSSWDIRRGSFRHLRGIMDSIV